MGDMDTASGKIPEQLELLHLLSEKVLLLLGNSTSQNCYI